MRIGLAGIPGSGKTELALALKKQFESEGSSVVVIDDYVPKIEKDTNLALGFSASYAGNIHVALGRAAEERKLVENPPDFTITCGTLFETSSYMAQNFEAEYSLLLRDDDKYNFAQRSEATMRIMACFYIDLVKYDHIFHLTPIHASDDDNLAKLEGNLQAAFEAFNLFEHNLLETEGSNENEITENRIKKVLEKINADNSKEQSVQVKESDGSGVRSGSEDGEEQATA